MSIKPIKTEADHTAALARLDAIFDAVPGTPEGDEAEVLVTLVRVYEEDHFPIDPPDPKFQYYVDYATFYGNGLQTIEQLSDDFNIPGFLANSYR